MIGNLLFLLLGVIMIICAYVGIYFLLIYILKLKEKIAAEISTILTIISIVSFLIIHG